jgi:hypothetical protein
MNCEKFENVVTDIARGQLTEASFREEATLHTKACESCAARLAQEQNLSVALRALALMDENKKADHGVEANLLNAFRNRTTTVSTPPVVVSPKAATATRNHRLYWWAAAAAVIVVALTLLALRVQNNQPISQPQAHENKVLPQQPDNQNPQNDMVKQDKKLAPRRNTPLATNNKTGELNRKNLAHPTAKLNSRAAKNGQQPNRPGSNSKPADEIATNFMPLYNIPMTEGGQVVRVELPRSALATFGLPVNAALADKPIKADVVIGNDGIARAIRFVQ